MNKSFIIPPKELLQMEVWMGSVLEHLEHTPVYTTDYSHLNGNSVCFSVSKFGTHNSQNAHVTGVIAQLHMYSLYDRTNACVAETTI